MKRQVTALIGRCYTGLGVAELRDEVLRRLRRIMPVDAAFFGTVDPQTLLFTSAAGLEAGAGGDDLEQLRTRARRTPWSGFGLAVGSVTLAGLPPTVGFVSEWFLLKSLMQQFRVPGLGYRLNWDYIRDNLVYGNGHRGNGWYWAGGITVAASSNVEIYGNRLSGNFNGITGTQQDRPDSTPPTHLLDHLQVHDNLICATGAGGRAIGVAAGNGADLASRDITFSRNAIQPTACE